jgi:hypothetical protein
MSDTRLEQQIADQPAAVRDEVVSINRDARNLSLQFALLVPLLAALVGLGNSFRMLRLSEDASTPHSGTDPTETRKA